jgi:hypothetical protein
MPMLFGVTARKKGKNGKAKRESDGGTGANRTWNRLNACLCGLLALDGVLISVASAQEEFAVMVSSTSFL